MTTGVDADHHGIHRAGDRERHPPWHRVGERDGCEQHGDDEADNEGGYDERCGRDERGEVARSERAGLGVLWIREDPGKDTDAAGEVGEAGEAGRPRSDAPAATKDRNCDFAFSGRRRRADAPVGRRP